MARFLDPRLDKIRQARKAVIDSMAGFKAKLDALDQEQERVMVTIYRERAADLEKQLNAPTKPKAKVAK